MAQISPMGKGDTLPAWTITVQKTDGSFENLTGATLSLIIHNPATGADRTGAGTWVIVNGANGVAQYQWVAADTNTVGKFELKVLITPSGGGQKTVIERTILEIQGD